ncbi:hypothetical protein ZWY2020_007199 [Hordeum vulgare]|nr:hypothetical protein ZWY2020_007199 [Hordeum vulgare]
MVVVLLLAILLVVMAGFQLLLRDQSSLIGTTMIPIIVVMKAMGIEIDQEVVKMVGRDPRYADLLYLSIQECATQRIYTQQQALQYMDDKVTYAGAGNIKVNNGNFQPKCIYIAVMLRRMLDAILNSDTFDDKASLELVTVSLY